MKFDTELKLTKPFGPWMLKAKLPEEVLNKMIKITDKISDDTMKISLGHGLAGMIEDEPFVPDDILKSEGIFDFFVDLGKYYVEESMKRTMDAHDALEHIISGGYSTPVEKKIYVKGDETIERTKPDLKINMEAMWIVNQKEGEYNPAHLHTNASISSVMYLKIPKFRPRNLAGKKEMDGKIEFIYGANGEVWQTFDSGTLSVLPEVGDLFMWPSDLLHTVYPFLGDGVRRSVSYNLIHSYEKKEAELPIQMKTGKVVSMNEARLETKIGLLEDELKKVKSKK